jgi:hypothetical protein
MALTITAQPAPTIGVVSAYAPILYTIAATTTYPNPPLVKAKVYVNGVVFGTEMPQTYLSEAGGVYTFEFDISERIQRYLSNTDTFNLGGLATVIPAADESNEGFAKRCEFYVKFNQWDASGATGIYELSAFSAESDPLYAVNLAANQYISEDNMQDYISILPIKFMTSSPTAQAIGSNDYAYLSTWYLEDYSRQRVRFRLYNSSSTLVATITQDVATGTLGLNRVIRFPSGTAYLNTITSLTGIAFYDFCLEGEAAPSVWVRLSEIRTYHIMRECQENVIHFLNVWGVDDSVRFKDYVGDANITKQSLSQTYGGYPLASARGRAVLNSQGQRRLAFTDEVPDVHLPYYYELANTVEAYIVRVGTAAYIAVDIESVSDFPLESTEDAVSTVEVVCNFANIDYAQTN